MSNSNPLSSMFLITRRILHKSKGSNHKMNEISFLFICLHNYIVYGLQSDNTATGVVLLRVYRKSSIPQALRTLKNCDNTIRVVFAHLPFTHPPEMCHVPRRAFSNNTPVREVDK